MIIRHVDFLLSARLLRLVVVVSTSFPATGV